jgi:activator of 2-hydroxyglutaryl-CoA dehydratase
MIALNDIFKKPADDDDAQDNRPAPENKILPFEPTAEYPQGLIIGLDVGSTTVKAVVVNPVTDEVLWKDFQRHYTKQPE